MATFDTTFSGIGSQDTQRPSEKPRRFWQFKGWKRKAGESVDAASAEQSGRDLGKKPE